MLIFHSYVNVYQRVYLISRDAHLWEELQETCSGNASLRLLKIMCWFSPQFGGNTQLLDFKGYTVGLWTWIVGHCRIRKPPPATGGISRGLGRDRSGVASHNCFAGGVVPRTGRGFEIDCSRTGRRKRELKQLPRPRLAVSVSIGASDCRLISLIHDVSYIISKVWCCVFF